MNGFLQRRRTRQLRYSAGNNIGRQYILLGRKQNLQKRQRRSKAANPIGLTAFFHQLKQHACQLRKAAFDFCDLRQKDRFHIRLFFKILVSESVQRFLIFFPADGFYRILCFKMDIGKPAGKISAYIPVPRGSKSYPPLLTHDFGLPA